MTTALEYAHMAGYAHKHTVYPAGNVSASSRANLPCVGDITLNGVGKAAWNEGLVNYGVADLCGNLAEYVYGVRIGSDYRIHVCNDGTTLDNSAAVVYDSLYPFDYYLGANTALTSSTTGGAFQYYANSTTAGSQLLMSLSGGTAPAADTYYTTPYKGSAYSADAPNLHWLGLTYDNSSIIKSGYIVNSGCYMTRGGQYDSGAYAGICSYSFNAGADSTGFGFRTTYIGGADE